MSPERFQVLRSRQDYPHANLAKVLTIPLHYDLSVSLWLEQIRGIAFRLEANDTSDYNLLSLEFLQPQLPRCVFHEVDMHGG